MSAASDFEPELRELCSSGEFDDNESLYEEVHDMIKDRCLGFYGRRSGKVNGHSMFNLLEFVMEDGSSLLLAEDEDGDVSLFVSAAAPTRTRH